MKGELLANNIAIPSQKEKHGEPKMALEVVYADICRPIDPPSNTNKSYFSTFIDDFSRTTWVYFLQEKSEGFSLFQHFKALVEKEVGQQIKVL